MAEDTETHPGKNLLKVCRAETAEAAASSFP
jgi:hypothetical protein